MIGDTADIKSRIRLALPTRWFPDTAPVLDVTITGLAVGWSVLYVLFTFVRTQARLATASGSFLDMFGADFFGTRLPRRAAEADDAYRGRLTTALTRAHATRGALSTALMTLTGRQPGLFEPARPADTGAYASPSLAYGQAGAWGNLSLPFQVLVTAYRPTPSGISQIAGYGTAGPLSRASLSDAGTQILDTDIYAAITSVMPTASIAWTRITN